MQFSEQSKLKAVALSYDDGITQDIHLIELLNKYNLKCTFNLNSELLGKRGILGKGRNRPIAHYKLHPEDVRYVYDGHEIAVHTLTHPRLPELEDAEVIRQVEQDRLNLSELAGYEVIGMAYPCGGVNNDDRVAKLIRENTGVRYARTITLTEDLSLRRNLFRFDPNLYHLNFDKMMEMGREFVEMEATEPQVLYIWGHSYEMDYGFDYWVKLEEFFRLISNREDIFYGTNKEILL